MKIAIDIDDVVSETLRGLVDFSNKENGRDDKFEDHTNFFLSNIWECSIEEAVKRVNDFFRLGHGNTLVPMAGAKDVLTKLKDEYEMVFITSRSANMMESTKKWLNKHFGGLNIPLYLKNEHFAGSDEFKKSAICKELGVDLIIEDAPHYIEDCSEAGIKVFIFDRPWNQEVRENDLITRVRDWGEIGRELGVE